MFGWVGTESYHLWPLSFHNVWLGNMQQFATSLPCSIALVKSHPIQLLCRFRKKEGQEGSNKGRKKKAPWVWMGMVWAIWDWLTSQVRQPPNQPTTQPGKWAYWVFQNVIWILLMNCSVMSGTPAIDTRSQNSFIKQKQSTKKAKGKANKKSKKM